jgi:D-threo-aldose 1-dehydrogenase
MDPLAHRRLGLTEVEITQLGFGGAGLGDLFEVIPEAQAAATLQAAWDAGIRYYDTAPWYGLTQSEHRFGRALYRQPRRDFVLSTKVGRTNARRAPRRDLRSRYMVRRAAVRGAV